MKHAGITDAGGRTLDAATVRDDRATTCGAVGASEIAAPSLPTVGPVSGVGVVSEKSAANVAMPTVEGPRRAQMGFQGSAGRAPGPERPGGYL